jgi:hypothetical protein
MNDRDLTPDELVKAAQFLEGMANTEEAKGRRVVTLPTPTVRRLADALLSAVNRTAA